jgi:hypothetical protein
MSWRSVSGNEYLLIGLNQEYRVTGDWASLRERSSPGSTNPAALYFWVDGPRIKDRRGSRSGKRSAMTEGSMASDWYYSKRGDPARQQIGPLTWEQFYAFAQAGTLTPDDLVWNPQFADWVPAAQVPGLFPAAATPAVQAPYPAPVQPAAVYRQATQPAAARSTGRSRSWLYWVVPLVVLVVVGAGLGAYFGFLRDGEGDGSTVSSDATTVASETTATTAAPTTTASTILSTTSTSATTTTLAATTTTLPPAIPGSHDSMTVGDFTFKITDVRIADEMADFPGGPWSNYKGALTLAQAGMVPTDLTPGDRLLMVFVSLETGESQSFRDADLRIVEGTSSRSSLVIMTEDKGKDYVWVYGVSPSSTSFMLLFPDNTMIDLTPLIT